MRRFAVTCLLFLFVNMVLANSLPSSTLGLSALGFDIKKANQQFDRINLQLSVQNLDIDNLEKAVDTLSDLVNKAEDCVEDLQKKINSVEILIKQGTSAAGDETKKEGADLIYLNNQRKELADEQAQCRLFTIRSKEAIEAYKNAIAELKQEEALTRGMPLWSVIQQTISAPSETKLSNLLTTVLPAAFPSVWSWLIIVCASVFSAAVILLRIRKSHFARHNLRFKKLHLHSIVLLSAFFISGYLFIYLLTFSQNTSLLPITLTGIVFAFVSALVLISFLFKLHLIRAGFFGYSLDIAFFQSVVTTSLCLYTIAVIGSLLSNSFNTSSPLWQLYNSVFLLIVLMTTGYYIFSYCKRHRHNKTVKEHVHFIHRFSFFILFTCALINIFGYYTLAYNLTLSGFTTFIIISATLLVTQSINKLYLRLSHQETIKYKVIKYFGYKPDQLFTEFLILKTIAQLIVIMISIYLIGQSWGFATDYIEIIYQRFLYGIHLADVTIYPTRIISGIIVFCVLYLIFRAISNAISNQQQFEDEEETQVAVASILTYIGFTLALISGFLVAGFDFTGLAIIAGALSVGIGLGLQSIVNNFVSGLILLIEKPIRPGDRINVDGIEGFVKKIRVRSTQIITTSREDIIIPNSDLITHRVTNYMFSDKYCRITCEVGVAYGSDTNLVREVLLNLANEHEEVIKSTRNKPVVLLHSFGDSNLMFRLLFLIRDVNKRSLVHSELNFAIERAFREHNICMAYPQCDVNLKQSELDNFKKISDEEKSR